MHKPILACAFMCLGLAAGEPTQAETWYLSNSVDSPNQGVAAPLEYCLRAIAIAGGVCGRDNYQSDDQYQSGDPVQAPQSARRAEKQRRDRRDRSER
jgi:hypothetical protein